MMRALLDVNVLIALLDAAHVHHDAAHTWLDQELHRGWASCPITQNGCIRVMSQPGYPGELRAADVAARLLEATRGPAHEFWPDDVDPLADDALRWDHILGHRQVTDAYLLALAVHHSGRFVTFDQRITTAAARGTRAEHLVTLS